jgi:aminopeptidase
MAGKKHQEMLKKYAEAIVKIGLNIQAGQRLVITYGTTRGVPLEFAPLVREVARAAYDAGARYVDVVWGDEEMLPLRAKHAPKDSFDEYSTWQIQAVVEKIEHGDALLSIAGSNPDLLGSLDPEIVGAMQQAHLKQWNPISKQVTKNADKIMEGDLRDRAD